MSEDSLQLLSQEPNPGVHYEYYLPLSDRGRGFSWSHGSWGDCSAECGGGEHEGLGEGTVRLVVPMKGCNLCQDKGEFLGATAHCGS